MNNLTLTQILALNHALTALFMSRQWSIDMGFEDKVFDDDESLRVINRMLEGTECHRKELQYDPFRRNSWPNVPQRLVPSI